MADHCPTCGQTVPERMGTDADALLAAMRKTGPRSSVERPRDVYRTLDGRWLLTYGHHRNEPPNWSSGAIDDLARRGLIMPHKKCPTEYFRLATPGEPHG